MAASVPVEVKPNVSRELKASRVKYQTRAAELAAEYAESVVYLSRGDLWALLDRLGISAREFARRIRQDERTVRRWCSRSGAADDKTGFRKAWRCLAEHPEPARELDRIRLAD